MNGLPVKEQSRRVSVHIHSSSHPDHTYKLKEKELLMVWMDECNQGRCYSRCYAAHAVITHTQKIRELGTYKCDHSIQAA